MFGVILKTNASKKRGPATASNVAPAFPGLARCLREVAVAERPVNVPFQKPDNPLLQGNNMRRGEPPVVSVVTKYVDGPTEKGKEAS